MPSEWPQVAFSKLCDITRGASPRPIHDWFADVGIPWVKISDANSAQSRYITETGQYIKPEGRHKSVEVRPGDLILSNSATPGIPKFMGINACIHDGWLLLRNLRNLDKHFAYYLLLHERPKLVAQGNGSVFTNLKTEILKNHLVQLPPISEQRAIAHILETLDDKIELNRRRNQTLEAMARAFFKDWFVDFGPVHAKMEGREAYLPADLWQRFPDRLDDGGKPEGWEMLPASELIEFNPTEPLRKGTPAPYLDMASLPTSGSWPEPPVIRDFGSGMRFRNGDTLLARITPCLENGKTAFVQCLPDETVGWGSTEYIVMRPKAPAPAGYAYLLARNDAFREHAIRSMTGTSGRQRAQGDSVAAFKLASPSDKNIWHAFGEQVMPLFESVQANAKANEILSQLRDTLLPKLISGNLRIADAERFIEERAA